MASFSQQILLSCRERRSQIRRIYRANQVVCSASKQPDSNFGIRDFLLRSINVANVYLDWKLIFTSKPLARTQRCRLSRPSCCETKSERTSLADQRKRRFGSIDKKPIFQKLIEICAAHNQQREDLHEKRSAAVFRIKNRSRALCNTSSVAQSSHEKNDFTKQEPSDDRASGQKRLQI